MSFGVALQLLLIALKLCDVIAWSWWAVLTPIILAVVIVVGVLLWMFLTVLKGNSEVN